MIVTGTYIVDISTWFEHPVVKTFLKIKNDFHKQYKIGDLDIDIDTVLKE